MNCPNGHKPPVVQYLRKEKLYVCTRCGLEWRKGGWEYLSKKGIEIEVSHGGRNP